MSRPPPTVTCLFFSDVTVAAFLNTPVGRGFAGDLLVECSLRPALSYVLNVETPANYPGVVGLLGGVDVGTLAHPTDRLPAPILLAPGAPVAAAAWRAALALCRRPDERINAITLLVPLADARALGAALGVAHRFAIAWDAVALPHGELLEFSDWLASEKLLTAENFAGLFPYGAEPLDGAHTQRLAALLGPLATPTPGMRADVISTPG